LSEDKKEEVQNPGTSSPPSPKSKIASPVTAVSASSSREEEMSMLRMMVNILEDSVNTMLRIEKTLNDRLSMLEKRMAETEKRLSDRIGNIGLSGTEKMEEVLGKAVNDMQKGMEIMVLQNMVEKVEQLAAQVRGQPAPEKKKPAVEEKKEEKYIPRVQRREREEREFRDRSKDRTEFREPAPKEEGEERLVRPSDLFGRGY